MDKYKVVDKSELYESADGKPSNYIKLLERLPLDKAISIPNLDAITFGLYSNALYVLARRRGFKVSIKRVVNKDTPDNYTLCVCRTSELPEKSKLNTLKIPDGYIPISEVQKIIETKWSKTVSEKTLLEWQKQKILKIIPSDAGYLVDKSSLDNMLEKYKVG